MNSLVERYFSAVLFGAFSLFTLATAVSIAAAQFALSIAVLCFIMLRMTHGSTGQRQSLSRVYLLIGLFVGWLIITSLRAEVSWQALWRLREEWLFLTIPVGVYLFQDRRKAEWLVLALAASVLIASLYGIGEHILGYDIVNNRALNRLDEQTIRLSGFFSHPLTFGNYIVTASLFLTGYVLTCARDLNRRHRFFLLSAAVLGIAACALANSRGPLLALGIGLLAVGIILRKIKYVIAVLAMVIVLGFTVSPTIVQRFRERFRIDTHLRFEGGRFFVWYHSLQVVGEHPLMGVGQGNFQAAYTTHLRPDIGEHRKYTHAHNDVLTFAAISGIPGAILYLTIWVLVIPRFWRAYRNSDNSTHARALSLAAFLASIAFFTSSLTEASFADEEVRQMLMLSWAAGLSVWYNKTDTKPEFRDKEINSLTS